MKLIPTSRCAIVVIIESVFLVLLVNASVVSSTKNDFTLTAEYTTDNAAKSQVTCTLINRSDYSLVFTSVSPSSAFQFKLFDVSGNIIPQEPKWANMHAQIGSTRYHNPGSMMVGFVRPDQKNEFQLDLKEAYGAKAEMGRILTITWENRWYRPDDVFDTPERKLPNGTVIPAHKEKIHFPGLLELTVSLPLTQNDGAGAIQPFDDQSPVSNPGNPTSQPPPEKSPEPPEHSHVSPWWWALLAIPLILLTWFGLRLWKHR